jgi:hypothetical protein
MLRSLLLILVSCGACRTTTTSSPAESSGVAVARAVAVRAWELWDAGTLLGSVVRYEEPGRPDRAFFGVRDDDHQDLGMIDHQGRAWRYRAHQREPEWVGTGTVLKGARSILGGSAASRLVEIGLQ